MKSAECKHHWLVPTSGMPEVISTCKLCGENRRMVNEWDKILDDMVTELGYLGMDKTVSVRRIKNRAERPQTESDLN